MDTPDDKLEVADAAGRLMVYVALATAMTTGALVGLWTTWSTLWVLGGAATGFLVWFAWALAMGLAARAGRRMPSPPQDRP
jgi:hypothetical protein